MWRHLLVVVSVLYAIDFGHAFPAAPAPFWWLNTYLNKKTIGRFEGVVLPPNFYPAGPCPVFQTGQRCSLDLATLPQSVKNIGVSLPAPFDTSINLGQAVPQGLLEIWLTEASDIELNNLRISGTSINPSREKLDVFVDRLKLGFRTQLRFANILIPGVDITINFIQVLATVNKTLQTKGNNVTLSVFLDAPNGKTFANALPRNISLVPDTCNLELDLGLSVKLVSGFPFQDSVTALTNFVLGVVQPVLGYVICHLIVEQAFTTVNGSPGIVREVLDNVFTAVGNLSSLPDPDISAEEARLVNILTPEQQTATKFSFKNSSLVSSLSQVVDEWLSVGNPPKVNEVVSLLTNPVDGTFILTNLQQWGVSVRVPTPPFYVSIDLINATISGLNTFKAGGFALLRNITRDYTFGNRLKLAAFGIAFTANIKLQDNFANGPDAGWITDRGVGSPTSASFQLFYNVSLKDVDLEAWISAIADISQVNDLQLGQLLGKSGGSLTAFQQLIDAGKCASPALYGFALPFFAASISDIAIPNFAMNPYDAGITALVNNVTDLGLRILESGIQFNLPDIVQHWARPLVNLLLRDLFVAGGVNATCPPYMSVDAQVFPNFLTSTLFSAFSEIIRDVVGGNPVQPNAFNINELIRIALNILTLTFNFPGTNPSPGQWLFLPDFRVFPGRDFPSDQPLLRPSQVVLNYLKFYGLNTVTRLLIDTVPANANGIDFNLVLGTVGLELQSRWTADYKVVPLFPGRANYVDEGFVLNVTLSGLSIRAKPTLNYDLDLLYRFTVKEVTGLWCLFVPLVSGDLDIAISVSGVQAKVTSTSYLNSVAGNELQFALQTLSSETHSNLANMINYILQSTGNFARRFLTRALPGLSSVTIQSCARLANPFDTVGYRLLAQILTSNFTDLAIKGLGEQPPPLTPLEADENVQVLFFNNPWDLSQSFFVPLLNDYVTRVSQPSFLRFMQNLGNSTANDLLSNLFETNTTDGSVGLDANLTSLLGANGFPLDFAIENATFIPRLLRLTKMSNLQMGSLMLFKPLSKFVTGTNLTIPGTMKFAFAFAIRVPRNFKNPAAPNNVFDTEEISFDFDLTDLMIDLQVVTGIDIKRLTALTIGNFVTIDPVTLEFGINWNFIDCLMGIFYQEGLLINRLLISLKTSQPTITVTTPNYIISQGTQQTLQAMLRMLFDFYIIDFPDITQGFIRSLVNDFILRPNVDRPNKCNAPTVISLPDNRRIFNFATNPTIAFLNTFLTQTLAGEDGSYSLFNTVLETAFTLTTFFPYNASKDYQTLSIDNLALVYKQQKLGFINASVSDIKILGGGTFTDLNLLLAKSDTSFFNDIGLRGPSSLEFTVRYSVDKLFKTPVHDELKLKFAISNVTIAALVNLQLAIPELLVVPLGGLTNISQIACALNAIEQASIASFDLGFKNFSAELSCVGVCSSPRLAPLRAGGSISTASFDSIQGILSFIPGVVALVGSVIQGSAIESWFQKAIADAENDCRLALDLTPLVEVINAPSNSQFMVSIICALSIAGIVAGCVVLAPLGIPRHYHLKTKLIASHLRSANEEPGSNAQSVSRYMAKMEREAVALFWHPAVSKKAKVIVPIAAVVNIIFLFLSFLWFAAFSIDFNIFFLGSQSQKVSLIPLTIAALIDNLWNCGAWVLALGLFILSGVWPIVKNLILLMLFFAPKWIMLPEQRRFVLHILDVLGKLSFIEAFVIVIVAAGIRFNIILSEVPILRSVPIPEELLRVNILVTVDGGMVILCVAAMATLLLNHYVIWEHEKAQFADRRLFKLIDGEEDLMLTSKSEIKLRSSDYVFSTKFVPRAVMMEHIHSNSKGPLPDGPRDRFEPRIQNLIILATGGTSLFLLIGQCLPFFSFQYDGLLGLGIELLIEGGRVRTYSLMNVGIQVQSLSDGTALTNFKLLFFQVLWYLAVIIAPHVQLWLHLIVWMVPMRLVLANKVFFFAKIAGYWSSVDVFAVAVIAIIIEINRVVSFLIDFIVGGSCSAAQPYIANVLEGDQAVCLKTSARAEYGFYVAWFAMMGQVIMGIIMIRANQIVLRDREDVLENRPHRMWSWAEYGVLRFMFAHGAEHHRPYLNPTSTILDKLFLKGIQWVEDPSQTTKQITAETLITTKHTAKSCCSRMCACFKGVDTISLDAPVGHTKASKWNAPPLPNAHRHVESGAGKWNAPTIPTAKSAPKAGPSRSNSQISTNSSLPPPVPPPPSSSFKFASRRQQSGAPAVPPPPVSLKVPKSSGSLQKGLVVDQPKEESSNPIFRREKTFSVDV